MGLEDIAKRNQVPPPPPRDLPAPQTPHAPAPQAPVPQALQASQAPMDPRERVVVVSLELSGRALATRSLEDIYFLLTNDIRTLIEFDRAFMISHMGGKSRLVAAGNQPITEKKSKFTEELDRLGVSLKGLEKSLLITKPSDLDGLSDDVLAPELREALGSYMRFAKCTGLLCVPMTSGGEILAHLLLEYLDGKVPDQIKVVALAKLAPVFGAALAQKYILYMHPGLAPLTQVRSWRDKPLFQFASRHALVLAITILALIALLFIIPFSYPVGGEAEIVPQDRHVAFAKIDGLIERIYVLEGTPVKEGQVIATLDPTEIDFKIKSSQRQLELLTAEMTLLKKSSGQDVSKLAESRLVELKARAVSAELQYLQWQRQFLQIKSPASGVITTKHVETLTGKKFKAGEPFCEIAVPKELWVEVYVPEDKVSRVKPGQNGDLHLNNDPRTAHPIIVKEVAPRAEAVARLGNIYRVRAAFSGDTPPPLKVGMKGVGTIYTEKTSVYSFVGQRLRARWNQFALHFL